MHIRQFFYSFQFHNNQIVYQQIKPVPGVEAQITLDNRQNDLLSHRKANNPKFMGEAGFVSAFEQSRAQGRMNFDRRADDSFADLVSTGLFTLRTSALLCVLCG